MNYSIDSIPFKDYGIYISNHLGQADLLDPKSQFFTLYGAQGYEITKRKGNTLSLMAYLIAGDITDFIAKVEALKVIFTNPGIRVVQMNNTPINCFCKDGFKIDKVRIGSESFGRFQIKLQIV